MGIKLQLCKMSPRDLLYNIVPIVSNLVFCILKAVKRADLTLIVLTMKLLFNLKKKKQRDTRKLLKVMNMSITLLVVIVSRVHVYMQTHHIVYVK